MATYLELNTIAADTTFIQRVKAACVVATETIRAESPNIANAKERKDWARRVLTDPTSAANAMVWAVLAQNAGAPAGNITGATDAVLQNAVNNAINLLALSGG